jgi:hypothetical protein
MAIRVKTGLSTWANVTELRVKTAINTWSDVIRARVQTAAGVWSDFFSATLTPTIQTRVQISASGGVSGSTIMNDSIAVTLTSTRYHWLNADGFTYIWQKSSNNSVWEDIGTAQSTSNPASGSSSSSITKVLSGSDFTSGSDMYFRFKFMATNSTYNTNASSESLSVLVSYYGTPIPQSPYPSITGSTTVGGTAFGNIGTWTNSPTSYDYRWFFMSGATSHPLTFSQARSVSNKTLSGFTATLTTSANHGYKANDTVIVSAMDTLFNGSHTITSKTDNTISLTLPTPTGWSASTAYSSGDLVSYLGNAYYAAISMPAPSLFSIGNAYSVGQNAWDGFTRYRCIQSISAVSAWSSGSNYATGSIIHYNGTRWQAQQNSGPGYVGAQTPSSGNYLYWSEVNVSLSNTSYWQNAYPYNSSYWTLQSFSNTATSGTTTAPNYYEGTVSSSTSISLTVPTTDYRSQLNMVDKALYFGVKAYNPATLSPSEYSNYKLVYGYPVITIGTIVPGSTTASIPYTHSYMTKYNIDILFGGTSIGGIYPTTVNSPSSPISVTGLTDAPRTYSYRIYPINGEDTYGALSTGTFTTIVPATISGISLNNTTLFPSSATSINTTSSSNVGTTSWTNGSNTSWANLSLVTGAGTLAQQNDPTSLTTSGTFQITSTGNANITIRAINANKTINAGWTQTNAQSHRISYDISGNSNNPQTYNGNSSASNPSVLLWTGAGTITLRSITVYPDINQGGTGVTLTSALSVTAADRTTNTTATNAVTYNSPPVTPTITYSNVTSGSFTVTWGSSGATSYNVSVYDSITAASLYSAVGTTATTVSPTGLQPNRSYSTTVTAINSVGNAFFTASTTTSLGAALTPTFGANSSISGGFTGSVTNYNSSWPTWNISTSLGSVSWGTISGSTYGFTVSGLASGQSATVTVSTPRTNYNTGSAQTTGSAVTVQYSVSWNSNGGTVGTVTTGPFNAGTPHTAPSPGTRDGFAFSNWRYPLSGDLISTLQPGQTYTPTQSGITFWAIWNAVTPTPTVSTISASTTGRSGTSPNFVFANPKATFSFTFTNTVSCTIHLDNSLDGINWTLGTANNLSVSGNAISLSTSLPSGTTSASGNYYYRARVNAWSGATQTGNQTGLKTSSSVRNTTTPVSNASLSFA